MSEAYRVLTLSSIQNIFGTCMHQHKKSRYVELQKRLKKYVRRLRKLETPTVNYLWLQRKRAFLLKRITKLTELLYPLRKRRAGLVLAAALSLTPFVNVHAIDPAPVISTISPAANAESAAVNSNIDITFDQVMDAATLGADNIVIHGSQSGYLSGNGAFSGNPVRTFNPDADFRAGELVTVSVTTGVENSSNEALADPLVYSFYTASGGGTGVFNSSTFGTRLGLSASFGDLDEDGNLDAVVGMISQETQIWLGNGDGTFSSSSLGMLGFNAIGDLDADGHLDVMVAADDATEVWFGNGDGTFSTTSLTGSSGTVRQPVLGDLDGDGDLDALIPCEFTPQPVYMWINDGAGGFSSSTLSSPGMKRLGLGDLDGDGDLDVFVPVPYQAPEIWMNNGDATFSTSTIAANPGDGVSLGDLDGDGNLDAIVTSAYGYTPQVWLGNGDGTFNINTFPARSVENSQLGDVDGDGDLDVVLAKYYDNDEIWFNNGSGTFNTTMFGTTLSNQVYLGDINDGGGLDILMLKGNTSQEIWLNQAPAPQIVDLDPAANTKDIARESDIALTFSQVMDVATLSADNIVIHGSQTGILSDSASFSGGDTTRTIDPQENFKPGELISVTVTTDAENEDGVPLQEPHVYSFTAAAQGGSGTFVRQSQANDQTRQWGTALGDLDGDGDLDAILGGYYGPSQIWLNNGAAAFVTSTFSPADTRIQDVALGDLDHDGDLDAVLLHKGGDLPDYILLNNGDGTFDIRTDLFNANVGYLLDIGDVDGDGDLDMVVGNYWYDAGELWLNNGDATFTSSTLSLGSTGFTGMAMGDMDGDGDLDVMASSHDALKLWRNNGIAAFSVEELGAIDSTTFIEDVVVGDLDGDGDLDAVFVGYSYGDSKQYVLTNNGDGTFTSVSYGQAGARSYDANLGDLDADGDLDVLVVNYYGQDEVWLNNGDGTFVTSFFSDASNSHSTAALGDLDGDGDLDALISSFGKENEVWLNQAPPPVVAIQDFATSTGDSTVIAVETNDEGLSLQIDNVSDPANGTAVIDSGAVRYTPDAGFYGLERFTYTLNGAGGSSEGTVMVAVPDINTNEVSLEYVEVVEDGNDDADLLAGANGVAFSPDGKHVYAVARLDDAVTVFSRDDSTCALTYIEDHVDGVDGVDGLNGPSAVAVSPDGNHVYITSYEEDAVAVFSRNTSTGALTYVERKKRGETDSGGTITGINEAVDLVVSPDGRNVYVTGQADKSIAVFARNDSNGTLTYVERHKDGVAGVDGLNKTRRLSISPDGKSIYVAGFSDNAVAVFDRDGANGTLTYVERKKDNSGGVDGLRGANATAVSPDGKYVYVTGFKEDAIAVFGRNQSTGALNFIQRYKNGQGGVSGMNGAFRVRTSPDNRHVYVTGKLDNALVMFERNQANGKLTQVDVKKDGIDGIDGLQSAHGFAVGPRSKCIVASGRNDDALAVFRRDAEAVSSNTPPVANNDSYLVDESTTLTPLSNDTDADNDALTITAITQPSNGTVAIDTNNTTLTFSPNISGSAAFSYTISDGNGGEDTAFITVMTLVLTKSSDASAGLSQGASEGNFAIAPNPVSDMFQVGFELNEESDIRLVLVDALGRPVAELGKGVRSAGRHNLEWNVNSGPLSNATSGMYILHLEVRTLESGERSRIARPVHIVR